MDPLPPLAAEGECHILPCNLGFTGPLPAERLALFRPVPLPGPSAGAGEPEEPAVWAAQFRGRGLLARPLPLRGHVLVRSSNGGAVRSVARFHRVAEWRHEHQPAGLAAAGRAARVADWCEVAAALHGPIHGDADD